MFSLSNALGFCARHAVAAAAREGPARHPLRHRAAQDSGDVAARREGEAAGARGPRSRLRRHRPAHRALLPPLPPARRGQLEDGGVARQGDGRAHLPRLQGRARPRRRGCCSRSAGKHDSRRRAAQLRRAADIPRHASSRPAAARTPAVRCSARSAARLKLLLGIGLDYLNFNRRSGTLSGGESQRIRLSTQIGSGLMGMLYVLDEPSIGLHPKDNTKMIATLESLRDIGNTVIVVEHDEDTIRAADHVVEMGPGPGVHGGRVVVQGTLDEVARSARRRRPDSSSRASGRSRRRSSGAKATASRSSCAARARTT